jgi:hypothetical protein
MREKSLATTTAEPEIHIKASGDLALKGHDRAEILAVSRYTGDLSMKQEGEVFQITCLDDCSVTVPAASKVIMERVAGDGRVTGLTGTLQIQKVGGDLALLQVGPVEIEKVGGDFIAQHILGSLVIQQTGGDFTGEDVQGAINSGKVGGDINLRQAGGGFEGRAGGDMTVGVTMTKLPVSNLRCGGDIHLFIQPGSSGILNITSNGEEIVLNINGNNEDIDERTYVLSLGEGGDELVLQAGGDVHVSDLPWNEELKIGFSGDFDMESLRHLDEEVNAHVERATRRAQEAAHRAEQRVQAAMNRIEQTRWGGLHEHNHPHEHSRNRVSINFGEKMGRPFEPPPAPRDPVTDEERLMVLKMVQDKKITVEEAEKLLRSMEGRR